MKHRFRKTFADTELKAQQGTPKSQHNHAGNRQNVAIKMLAPFCSSVNVWLALVGVQI